MKPTTFAAATAFVCALAVPGAAVAANAFATGNVNLRAGPGTGYPAVTTVNAGAGVNVYGCLSGYSWCDISYRGVRGWVSGRYLEYIYDDRRVLVPAYAASFGAPIISFSFGNYWDNHYRGYDFYDRDRRENRRDRKFINRERNQFERDRGEIRADIQDADTRAERRALREERRDLREDFREEVCEETGRRCD